MSPVLSHFWLMLAKVVYCKSLIIFVYIYLKSHFFGLNDIFQLSIFTLFHPGLEWGGRPLQDGPTNESNEYRCSNYPLLLFFYY